VSKDIVSVPWEQSSKTQYSEGRLVPTGCGSLNWKDVHGLSDLVEIVSTWHGKGVKRGSTRKNS